MNLRALANRVDGLILDSPSGRDTKPTGNQQSRSPDEGLFLLRYTAPTAFEATIYQPIVCLILQGEKQTQVGEHRVTLSKGKCLVISHDTPVVARVTKASPAQPYLALVIRLDLGVLRNLYAELGDVGGVEEEARAFAVAEVDGQVRAIIERYLCIVDDPVDLRVLGPALRRELHYRLVTSASGGMLRSLLRRDSHASRIATAIETLRDQYRQSLEVAALARGVGMSTSSFHKHFKLVTMTTPLQYQKNLRLTEARQLLKSGAHSVSTTAFEVGYESPSQFSREYSRKFGVAPQADLMRPLRPDAHAPRV